MEQKGPVTFQSGIETYDEALRRIRTLKSVFLSGASNLGRSETLLEYSRPAFINLGSDSNAASAFQSGIANVAAISVTAGLLIDTVSEQSTRLAFFNDAVGAFAAGTSVLNRDTPAVLFPDSKIEETLPKRLGKFDPELEALTRGVFENLYATQSAPERSAAFLMRQTWDMFFARLAPDDSVRTSSHWKAKDGEDRSLVTREERISYAVATHVKDRDVAKLIEASSKYMRDLYRVLNKSGHAREPIDETETRNAVNAIARWLALWADALGL